MTTFTLDKLDIALLRRLAGSRSYARGEEYFNAEAVERIVETDGKITATVQGSHPYRVALWAGSKSIDYSCSNGNIAIP